MAKKVEFGLSNVWVALATAQGDGTLSFGVPHHIPGAVNMTLEPTGSLTEFYADDIKYFSASGNQGYTGSLEMALFDEWFYINVMGYIKDSNGVMVENAAAIPKPFALLYQVQDDVNASRRVLYNVTCERGSQTHSTTNESIEVNTQTVNITASPLPGTLDVKAHTTEDTPSEVYEGWFEAVQLRSGSYTPVTTLESLSLGTVTLDPVFASETLSYTATTTNATNTISAVATNAGAEISITNNNTPVANNAPITWQDGSNTVKVTVTDDTASSVYTITVTKS